MLKRIWNYIKWACTPHWDNDNDSGVPFLGATNQASELASIIQAAQDKAKKKDGNGTT